MSRQKHEQQEARQEQEQGLWQALQLLLGRLPDLQQDVEAASALHSKVRGGGSSSQGTAYCILCRDLRCIRQGSSSHIHICSACSQDGARMLALWHRLLVQPATTLPAAGCLRGLLLRVASSLVVAAVSGAAPQHDMHAVSIALMRVLELCPPLER